MNLGLYDSKICALSQTHTPGLERTTGAGSCLYHVAPKKETRLGGKKYRDNQTVFPEAQTDVLRQDVCRLPVAPEPSSNTCLSEALKA